MAPINTKSQSRRLDSQTAKISNSPQSDFLTSTSLDLSNPNFALDETPGAGPLAEKGSPIERAVKSVVNQPISAANFYTLGPLKFWAMGDRVIIEEDEFRSGYECATCNGVGRVASPIVKDATTDCPDCGGKGGLLIAPDTAQRRPTSGRVVSIGTDCKRLLVGQSVLYSNFAGYVIDLDRAGRKVTLRILHENEILCGLEGQLEMKTFRGKSDIASFSA